MLEKCILVRCLNWQSTAARTRMLSQRISLFRNLKNPACYEASSVPNVYKNSNAATHVAVRNLRLRSRTIEKQVSNESWDPMVFENDNEPEKDRHPKRVLPPKKEKTERFSVENADFLQSGDKTQKRKRTGMDLAQKMREQKRNADQVEAKEMDSGLKKAIHALRRPNLNYLKDEELAKLIRKHVIYVDKKLVIFNKPYGLVAHDGDGTQQSIKNVLPMVSKMVYGVKTKIPLTMCHRLDQYATGVLVCAADSDMASHVMKMMRLHLCVRKYWAVVVGTPDPMEGVIDIPIGHTVSTDRTTGKEYSRMITRPDFRYDLMTGDETQRRRTQGSPAVTNYRVIDFNRGLSLIEMQPLTSAKHQLRVHTADGLDCGILGDHKYAKMGSLAPQTLPPGVLKRFNITQEKTRNMPMHFHHHSILIPDVFQTNKRHLIALAKLPTHIHRTINMFNLQPGIPSGWNVRSLRSEKSAVPLDPSSELYRDPTAQPEPIDMDTEEKCIKVYKPQVKVKYQKW